MGDAFQSLKARRAVGRSIELKLASMVAKDVLANEERFGTVFEGEELPPSSPGFVAPEETSGKKKLEELRQKAAAFTDPSSIEARLAQTAADLEKAKRDERSGLYTRGVYFDAMEAGFEKGQEVSTIAIDMAFLKYFDKEGGPGTGDLAVKKAVEVLDNVATKFKNEGIEVEAFRVGGDEFAMTIVGGDGRTIQEVVTEIREGARLGGRIPPTAGASARYKSEGLQFNYGVRRALNKDAFRLELELAGVPLKTPAGSDDTNELAEYLVRLADKEVEIQKGVNRLMMLLDRTVNAGEESNLEMLKAYSQKAIFGAAGEAKLAEFAKQLADSPERTVELGRIRGKATEFVVAQLDAKNAQVAHFESSLDKRLEDAVRIRFFEQRIAELEDEIDALHAQVDSQSANHEMYRQAARAAEEEKQAIVQLRERMQPTREEGPRPQVRKAA
jgi:GGDEF domain-containing protein